MLASSSSTHSSSSSLSLSATMTLEALALFCLLTPVGFCFFSWTLAFGAAARGVCVFAMVVVGRMRFWR
ncbi:hypothetical protein B0T17DRAFT_540083 [Bombardia bombarda]|uniref:Uncharacterized protein n=1 Tax=Bombardia bombarda TaxID=252184 RepID=A0AA39WIJ9_9PEZI|nr:hypothetical protein B0T17DRAFT_540083 [Bombardia bombarda]